MTQIFEISKTAMKTNQHSHVCKMSPSFVVDVGYRPIFLWNIRWKESYKWWNGMLFDEAGRRWFSAIKWYTILLWGAEYLIVIVLT